MTALILFVISNIVELMWHVYCIIHFGNCQYVKMNAYAFTCKNLTIIKVCAMMKSRDPIRSKIIII